MQEHLIVVNAVLQQPEGFCMCINLAYSDCTNHSIIKFIDEGMGVCNLLAPVILQDSDGVGKLKRHLLLFWDCGSAIILFIHGRILQISLSAVLHLLFTGFL